MDYEKKYKEEVVRATQLWECGDITREQLEYIFPELKESEDERIRKELCKAIWTYIPNDEAQEYIKWLEKQGQNEYDKDMWSNSILLKNNRPLKKEHIAWLEKQGEKPQGKTALEAIKEEKVDNADKVEPKFREGDFIKHNKANIICEVISVNSGSYYVANIETKGRIELFNEELQNFHLWTIEDAKDGDVLVDKYNNIGIFQKCEGICWHSYIPYLGCDGELRGYGIGGSHGQTDTHPATKEQRNLLFQKMKEDGYEWDAEKKVVLCE